MTKRKHQDIDDAGADDAAPRSKRQRLEPPQDPHQQAVQAFVLELAPLMGVAVEPPDEDPMEGVELLGGDPQAQAAQAAEDDEDTEDEQHDWDGQDPEGDEDDGESEDDDEALEDDELSDEPDFDEATFDPTRLYQLDPMVLRSGTQLTDLGPLMADGKPRSTPLDKATALDLFEKAKEFRDLRRKSFKVEARKPTFYGYMVAPQGQQFVSLFTATPYNNAVEAMAAEQQAQDPQFSVEMDSEFALDPALRLPARPTKVKGKANLEKDHIKVAEQGPHSLAHVLIEEMLKRGLPPDKDARQEPEAAKRWAARRERWVTLEGMYLSQVDTPQRFRNLVMGELQGQASAPAPERIEFAVQRHQELFNQIEALLSLHAARKLVVGHVAPDSPAAWLEDQLREDGEDFEEAHRVLGELMELAPFGSYAWHKGRKASKAQTKGKGERRKGLDEAMRKLREARKPDETQAAVEGMAVLLAKLFDYEAGQFVDLDAYKSFLTARFELVGSPDEADRLLQRVLQLKGVV